MELVFLVKSFTALVFVLGVLLYLLFRSPKKKRPSKQKIQEQQSNSSIPTFESLVAVIKDKKSTNAELSEAIDKILHHYGKIHPKMGVRSHPSFDTYGLIMLKICHHPNIDKSIVLKYEKGLRTKNPEYAKEINEFLIKGLDTRGF